MQKKKIINEFNCYRCKKPVKLTKIEDHPGKIYDILWINYKEGYAYLCPSCTLNMKEFLGVRPYKIRDLYYKKPVTTTIHYTKFLDTKLRPHNESRY